jgi:hypothetical protein
MPDKKPYGSPGKELQPDPQIIDNPPAATVAQALANNQAVIDKAKRA